ncbi:NAD(P)/FAD-dependent oxidoreductase [Bordetella sp. 02P26C-1]|uniref:NAD(P)/FAD-dependent oxidoreductase n=1 Tax=Bordetella sp. 02P26C-1 TaxID=2683195 RepID=UPI001354641A|nr:FAD-dependent oxidoreductase [Bordetella sp. 02P26C-1]MVW78230.1 ferredoxin reductase [Bordetella sp. 02P26C-1]
MHKNILIVGGGHAASQLCGSLLEGGYTGALTLISEEACLPYHRPPLSKAYLSEDKVGPPLLRPASAYGHAQILLNTRVTAIDRTQREVTLSTGERLPYDALVLATGTRARKLPDLPDTLDNVHYLRTHADAERLRDAFTKASSLTVLGGGFIGLEIAATGAKLGKRVEVFENAQRLLARAVSPEISETVAENLVQAGVALNLDCGPVTFDVADQRVTALNTVKQQHPVELLVVGIGAVPEVSLAQAIGLTCENGIRVDSHMRTEDPAIFAIGDCAHFPYAAWNRPMRLESVQNANDQARTLAAVLLDQDPQPYAALPWFWSDQGSLRLQIAGLMPAQGERLIRPGPKPGNFSILHFDQDRLVCVESINAPLDHIAARKLLLKDSHPEKAVLVDPAIHLKTHL